MNFKPKSENEIAESQLWPKGEYDFECIKSERAVSGDKSKTPGTEFIKLLLKVWNADGGFRFVNAILHPAMEAQVRHFCVAGNLMPQYEAGTLTAEECIGVSGRLKLKVKEADGNFPAKNEVQDYVVEKKEEPRVSAPTPDLETAKDDDIPF